MNRIYHPYYKWECYLNGMYSSDSTGTADQAILVLSDCELFDHVLGEVIYKWKFSAQEHLSNKAINRQAWCGQVACCYYYNVPETQTRIAWKMISDIQRYKANTIADKHIKNYEKKNRAIHIPVGNQLLFKWDS